MQAAERVAVCMPGSAFPGTTSRLPPSGADGRSSARLNQQSRTCRMSAITWWLHRIASIAPCGVGERRTAESGPSRWAWRVAKPSAGRVAASRCRARPGTAPARSSLDRHAIAVELVVLVVASLSRAQVRVLLPCKRRDARPHAHGLAPLQMVCSDTTDPSRMGWRLIQSAPRCGTAFSRVTVIRAPLGVRYSRRSPGTAPVTARPKGDCGEHTSRSR